jgi:hypothetical protein
VASILSFSKQLRKTLFRSLRVFFALRNEAARKRDRSLVRTTELGQQLPELVPEFSEATLPHGGLWLLQGSPWRASINRGGIGNRSVGGSRSGWSLNPKEFVDLYQQYL